VKLKTAISYLFSALTAVPLFFTDVAHAEVAPDELILDQNSAAEFGLDFRKVESVFDRNSFFKATSSNCFKIKFHEENTFVDISSLDGFSVRVDIAEVSSNPPNGRVGGG